MGFVFPERQVTMIELSITDPKQKTPIDLLPGSSCTVADGDVKFPASRRQLFTIKDLISQTPALPVQTAILGRTMENVPVLFDLNDPKPGAILIVADRFSGKTALLKTIAHSLRMTNRPYEVGFHILSGRPEQWKTEHSVHGDYFKTVSSNYQRTAADTILAACDLVESRQNKHLAGPAQILMMDGMDTLPLMDADIRLNFEWLLQEGPAVQVWPIVSVESETAVQNQHWVNLFRTRLAGFMHDSKSARLLSLIPQLDFTTFERGRQFAVRIGRSWLQFLTPENPY